MNRSALKSYAPRARLDFIRAVTDRAAFYGVFPDQIEPITESGDVVLISGRAFPRMVSIQRRALVDRIQEKGFDQVMEAMAYTWFNRFVALHYMELHGYLDHGYRVFSQAPGLTAENAKNAEKNSSSSVISAISVVQNPEILDHAEHVTLPGLEPQKVIELKLNGGQDAVLYRLLLVAQCNALHQAMPFLFEKIADETELLLPDNLLHSDSVIRKLVNEIEEADWQQVEIIGWLYQFYISDKKDEVIGKVVKSEDIPAATQLFTPNWIVKYLVQNTLGRQWLATYPDSPLRQQMEYYIEPAEQTDDVKAQLAAITPQSLDPETLTLLDDACGSGHILVEAYDLFKAIYQERGYRSKDIPRLILEKNLFGLEIDDRAAQLAAFALLMKARADDRRIFADRVQPNVLAIQDSKGLESLLTPDPNATAGAGELPFVDRDLFPDTQKQLTLYKPAKGSPLAAVEPCLRELIRLFEHGKTFGSLIRIPSELASQLPAARQSIELMIVKGQLWEHRAAILLLPLVRQAELLATSYDTIVANPPYMVSKFMTAELKEVTRRHYPQSASDLYAVFLERSFQLLRPHGYSGMVTMHSWMFLSSFEEIRVRLLNTKVIMNMAHLGARAFGSISGEIVQVAAASWKNSTIRNYRPIFYRLTSGDELEKQQNLLNRRNEFRGMGQDDFAKMSGSPLLYWIPTSVMTAIDGAQLLTHLAKPKKGFDTGSTSSPYFRFWWEVEEKKVYRTGRALDTSRWVEVNKGGSFRRWYGNRENIVLFGGAGMELYSIVGANIRNKEDYFSPGLTYAVVCSGDISVRESFQESIFYQSGGTMQVADDTDAISTWHS